MSPGSELGPKPDPQHCHMYMNVRNQNIFTDFGDNKSICCNVSFQSQKSSYHGFNKISFLIVHRKLGILHVIFLIVIYCRFAIYFSFCPSVCFVFQLVFCLSPSHSIPLSFNYGCNRFFCHSLTIRIFCRKKCYSRENIFPTFCLSISSLKWTVCP